MIYLSVSAQRFWSHRYWALANAVFFGHRQHIQADERIQSLVCVARFPQHGGIFWCMTPLLVPICSVYT